ncbi:hypothetical protein Tco_0811955, partial [Tanacetum coccineum]
AQLVRNDVVRVKIPRFMSWLDAYDKPIYDLDMMEDKVDNPSPQSTPQVLPSFKEFPSVDEPEPQPLLNFPSLDINLGDKRGTNPSINPYSPGSFRMKTRLQLYMKVGEDLRTVHPDGVRISRRRQDFPDGVRTMKRRRQDFPDGVRTMKRRRQDFPDGVRTIKRLRQDFLDDVRTS